MRPFELRLGKLFSTLKDHNVETEKVVLQSKYALNYIFADLYSPPPEELGVFAIIIDMNTMELDAYVSSLEYYRIVETYSYVQNLAVHPVAPSTMGIEFDTEIVDVKDMKNNIARVCKESRRISVDSNEICGNDSSSIRIDIRSIIKKIRRNKSEEEVKMIRKAIEIAEKAIEDTIPRIKNGLSEQVIAGLIESRARELGAEGFAFSTIVAIGANTSKPHHIPSSTIFRGNEPIVIDFGVRVHGYVSDITRIILPSNPQKEAGTIRDFANIISDAIDSSIQCLKVGERYSNIDEVARSVLMKSNIHRYFVHGLGHGIGVDVHEEPRISKASDHEVELGDVITIEPGIYMHKKFGIRIEDDVYVAPSRPIKLTSLRRVIEL
ncbi:MAG: M24 family metallopeptidase [Ignisphaera sp.]|nr:M24 family metallopeptidase [Ignisphaera sp.]MCX8168139.1 M24 family metallopeptidase [Ignisphaera sp.]MDW8085427.1 M24 family metallopeptidase [Ignisphaera sp.]